MSGRRPLNGPDDPRHGTYNGYYNGGCRCDACTKANTDYHRSANRRRGRPSIEATRAARKIAALARDNHGTETRYNQGCRCDDCRRAARDARRRRRHQCAPSPQKCGTGAAQRASE